jgi:hypothetical protein
MDLHHNLVQVSPDILDIKELIGLQGIAPESLGCHRGTAIQIAELKSV